MGFAPLSPDPQRTNLVGIARLAAASPMIKHRAQVEFFQLDSRSALNRESSGRMPFAWTLNPYRGCEFGCQYCYARYTHEFMEMWDSFEFERKIYAKVDAPQHLRAELRQGKDKGLPIALGTATDPYQPAERQFEITRKMLQVFREFRGLDLSITTKSVLMLRDLDLLKAISEGNRLSIHMTITTADERLARLLEPKAPPPAQRMEAIRKLSDAGIRIGVNAMPILPGLNDSPSQLDALASCAAKSGARFLYGNVLFLSASATKHFMPFLEREFPRLVKRYRKLYAHSAYLHGEYPQQIKNLIAEVRTRHGLGSRSEPSPEVHRPQMALPFDSGARLVEIQPALTACHNAA
jgi:DNA repair photolyase